MAAAYHHGTETIRIDGGSNPVYTVDGAITAIVGTAPVGAVNELTVCQTKKDFAQFGGELTGKGFTLPDAANIWTRYASGVAYVINVCDPARHKTQVQNEVLTVDSNTLTAYTAKPALLAGYALTDGASALTEGQHYTINTLTGEIVYKTKPTAPKISYSYADPTKVTEADIIGAYVAATGKRTGLELLSEGYNRQGADAKIIIVPNYDKTATVAAKMITVADNLNAIAYINAPEGTTLSKALEGRGPLGTINFQTSSDRAELFFPHVIGLLGMESLATHAAGLRMKTDVEQGYWFSKSNRELLGVTGVEIGLTARADDPQSETNRLNEKGITTVFNSYGTGYRMSDETVRPLCDTVIVRAPEVVEYKIDARLVLFKGADSKSVLAAASAAWSDYETARYSKLGKDVVPLDIQTALKVSGVYNVILSNQYGELRDSDVILIAPNQWARCVSFGLSVDMEQQDG